MITLLALGVFSALGLGLVLTTSVERITSANYRDGVAALYAADAGLELAARELASIDEWSSVLGGSYRSRYTDGPPSGVRVLSAGDSIDLGALTNQLTCGRTTTCTEERIRSSTADRPWGANNPRWQPFVFGTLGDIGGSQGPPADAYVMVWLGDDAREVDGDPLVDGGGDGAEGRFVLRARAEAFGPGHARRVIEADLVRRCYTVDLVELCQPGSRVQSWRVHMAAFP